jgi:hypothetical protein
MTFEAACPFTGYGAHSAFMEDMGAGLFCLLIPQTQQHECLPSIKHVCWPDAETHICDPMYLGGGDWDDSGLRLTQAKSL